MRLLVVLPFLLTAYDPEPASIQADEALLKEAQLPIDPDGLLQFFRQRTLKPEQREQIADLIRKLGAKEFAVREKAAAGLRKHSSLARALLIDALSDPNPEIVQRVKDCLRQLDLTTERAHASAVARLLGHHKPAAAIPTLLAYLPYAGDDTICEEIRDTFAVLAMRDGKLNADLSRALVDPLPLRRLLVGEALCKLDARKHKALVLPLLRDPDRQVRLHLALAFIEQRQKEGVPVLISLIAELPMDDAWRAEEVLSRLAGDEAPTLLVDGKNPAGKVRDAWAVWWKKAEAALDQAKQELAPKYHGFVVISMMDDNRGMGKIYELDAKKEIRWEMEDLRYPVDVQILGPDRILVTEYLGRRVTERDLKGNILWERAVALPTGAQRLPNGQTFIAARKQLLVLDKEGKEVFTYFQPGTTIAAATRLRDGFTVLVAGTQCIKIDPAGKQVRAFEVGMVYTMGGNIEALPGDRVLVPEYRNNRVAEYDAEGKVRWEVAVQSPTSVTRLPNGETLVVSLNQQRVIAFDRAGKEVWAIDVMGRPWRARGR